MAGVSIQESFSLQEGNKARITPWYSRSWAKCGNYFRYGHGGEITAVDVTARGAVIVTGSRDKNFLVWNIQEDPDRDALLPVAVQRTCVDDCVWCGAAYDLGLFAVGTAGTRGVLPVRLCDLATGNNVLDMGTKLQDETVMLDVTWLSTTTILACAYD